MYVIPRAVLSWWQQLTQKNQVRALPGGEVILFALAGGIIMRAYEYEPQTIGTSIYGLMQRYFGKV